MLKTQKNIENKLTSAGSTGIEQFQGNADLTSILRKQQTLEQRITALESQFKGVQTALQQAKAGGRQRQAPPPEDFSKVHDITAAHSPVIGKQGAPVTIVEFVDFECPYCARFHPPMVEAAKAYPGKVNYIIKNFPLNFHKNAMSSAKAAFAAGEQGKYSEMADALLLNGKSLSEEKYEELAKSLGLDVDKFLKDYKEKDAQWEDYIKKDMALGAKVGVRGTPSFYINGKKTRARDTVSFKKEIDQILKGEKK